MLNTIFPFVWLSGPNAEDVGPQRVKDFRPRPVSADYKMPTPRIEEEPVDESPKGSSVTGGAGDSEQGSRTSLKVDGGNSASAAKDQTSQSASIIADAPKLMTPGNSLLSALV